MGNSYRFVFILGASQRHIRMIPCKCYSETVVYVVSDGQIPGSYWMGEGWGYGVWVEKWGVGRYVHTREFIFWKFKSWVFVIVKYTVPIRYTYDI